MPQIIPVIHYADDEQAIRNAGRAFEAGCEGIFLIHMEGRSRLLPPIARRIKDRWPDRLVGINFLGVGAEDAIGANISCGLDMTWTDEQLTHSAEAPWDDADKTRSVLDLSADHLLFMGVAFKHQRHEPDPSAAARRALDLGFIPTTSGPATGVAAEQNKIAELRAAIGNEAPLGIASGITPENAPQFAPLLSHILVATGVSSSFHDLDPARMRALRAACDLT